jgi:L-alanine-DL-glutamate epimerase-like enolase superfamily enzyme
VKITGVRCILVSAPYATPGDAERLLHLKTGYRSAALIEVETDEGISGVGETYAGVYAPEAVAALVAQLVHDLVGQDALDTLAIWQRMRHATYYWGRLGLSQSTIGGIETALWDLKGKALGRPVYELLGGKRHDALLAYASGGNDKPFAELERELRGYLDAGYRAVKIRINNLTLAQIEEKVAFCRQVLGSDVGLAVDAVQGTAARPWSVKTAVAMAKAIEPYDLLWIEEPAEVTNYAGFAEIRRQIATPVAGGESVTSLQEAERYLEAGALDLFQPDAGVIGGIGVFRRVAELCERAFLPVAAHAWASGVGVMANYHAAFASPNCTTIELPSVPNPLRDELLAEPLTLTNGTIAAPTGPGLGVVLPDDLEERYPYRPGSVYRILAN